MVVCVDRRCERRDRHRKLSTVRAPPNHRRVGRDREHIDGPGGAVRCLKPNVFAKDQNALTPPERWGT